MFRIEAFCEDKHLARVHLALVGLVVDLKTIPVVNATLKKGKLVAQTGGSLVEMFAEHLNKTKPSYLTPGEVKAFVVSVGRRPGGYSNLLRDALKAELLKKTTTQGRYAVTVRK